MLGQLSWHNLFFFLIAAMTTRPRSPPPTDSPNATTKGRLDKLPGSEGWLHEAYFNHDQLSTSTLLLVEDLARIKKNFIVTWG